MLYTIPFDVLPFAVKKDGMKFASTVLGNKEKRNKAADETKTLGALENNTTTPKERHTI